MKNRSTLRRIAALLLGLAVLLPWTAMATETTYATITADSVHVRTGPGINYGMLYHEGSEILLRYGYGVIVTGPARAGEDGDATPWYPVEVSYNGATYNGFIRSDLMSLMEVAEPDPILPGNATFSLSYTSFLDPGSDLDLTLTLTADRPIGAWLFELEYDASILTYLSGADGAASGKLQFCDSADGADHLSFLLHFSATGRGAGSFRIKSAQIVGYDDLLPMTVSDVRTTYLVEEMHGGDANGDGKINSHDIIRLKNYLAYFDYDTGTSAYEIAPGADANGDGKITSADIVRLKNYLANYQYDS